LTAPTAPPVSTEPTVVIALRGRVAGDDRAPGALHHEQRAAEAAGAQLRLERVEVGLQPRAHLRAHDGRGRARVLADARADLARQPDVEVGRERGDQLAHAQLMPRVSKRPQQRDGDRLDVECEELFDRARRLRFVERDDDLAGVVDALVDLAHARLGDQRRRLARASEVLDVLRPKPGVAALEVHDHQRVGVAARGEEADARDVAGDQRVERGRRPVRDQLGVAEQLCGLAAECGGELAHDRDHAAREVGRRRRGLRRGHGSAVVGGDGVGERAADVDPDDVAHQSQGPPASQRAPRSYRRSTSGPVRPGMSGLTSKPSPACR
jgi:hypothetical protein